MGEIYTLRYTQFYTHLRYTLGIYTSHTLRYTLGIYTSHTP